MQSWFTVYVFDIGHPCYGQLLVFSVTPFKIDQNQNQNRIWEMKESKYAKTFAKILVTAIFLMQDMRRNFYPNL